MNNLIIYGSQYGTTKRYAEKFAEMMDFPVISYENIKSLTEYDRVIYFGGLYAGGVKGLKSTVKKLSPNTKLVIVTVGLADVCDEENIVNIRNLSFKHKTMMTLLYNRAKKLPEDRKTAEDRAMIETFNSKLRLPIPEMGFAP